MFVQHWIAPLAAVALAVLLALAGLHHPGGASEEAGYVVRPGDTLWALAAARYAGDPREGIWRISERNGLRSASLRPGMTLYLPAPGGGA